MKWPLSMILELSIDRNSFNLGSPSPVTLEMVKMGQILSEASD